VYTTAEMTKESDTEFTYRTSEGEEKTLPKNEKNFMPINPAKFDGIEDMAEMSHLSEPSVLYNLTKRYDVDLFHVRLSFIFCYLKQHEA